MRNRILAIAAIAGAIGAPIAAQAQGVVTTGVAPRRRGAWSRMSMASQSISVRRSANISFANACRTTPFRTV